jgi:glucose/mannose-6-phosphate isomerase
LINLDADQVYQQTDPAGMAGIIERFPEQAEEAWRIGSEAHVPADYADVDNIVIQGMGGSAIGGDLLRALLLDELKIPAMIVREYDLPIFSSERTLFIASSYSGNTEETLSGYATAKMKGCKILTVSSGGRMSSLAAADGYPLITIPGGISPRAALGYSFFPLLAVLGRLGLIPDQTEGFRETLRTLRNGVIRLGRSMPSAGNPAKDLALWLHGRCPLIYAAGAWPGVVAMRWKGQMNENAKNIAFYNILPELNHNEIVGFEAPAALINEIRTVFLRTGDENDKVGKRMEVTADVITRAGGKTREVKAEGRSSLCRMFSLIQFGDFVSLYLAMLNGIDPTPVKVIEMLKGELAKLD